jgi:hypothetical protein
MIAETTKITMHNRLKEVSIQEARSEQRPFKSVRKMSLPDLAAEQGQIGGWEFAKLSFPC